MFIEKRLENNRKYNYKSKIEINNFLLPIKKKTIYTFISKIII